MEIDNVEKIIGFVVETDDGLYTRYGPDSWMVAMGESDEPVYYCEELEALFQEYVGGGL